MCRRGANEALAYLFWGVLIGPKSDKNERRSILSSTVRASEVSNLLFGTQTRCVCVELPGFPEQQYTA